jgi:MATE family multidrug resistance protein
LLKIGYPIGIAMFLEYLGFNLITILVGREAGILAATHNIAVTITTIAYMIPMSISAAIAIKVGYFNGARILPEIKRYSAVGTIMSVLFMFACSLILTFFPKEVFCIFTNSKEMLLLGIPILHIAAYYMMFDGLQVSLSGILKGLKMTKVASITLITGYWLFGLPVGYYLAYHLKMSLNGFWIGLAVSFLAMSILFGIIIIRKFKQLNKTFD